MVCAGKGEEYVNLGGRNFNLYSKITNFNEFSTLWDCDVGFVYKDFT
jgi:hypothetical protein